MKNSQKATEKEIEKLKKTINDSEREVRALERKKQETQALLKKFYQKKYIYDTYQNENVNFMTLLYKFKKPNKSPKPIKWLNLE